MCDCVHGTCRECCPKVGTLGTPKSYKSTACNYHTFSLCPPILDPCGKGMVHQVTLQFKKAFTTTVVALQDAIEAQKGFGTNFQAV